MAVSSRQKGALEVRVQDLEHSLDSERASWLQRLREREADLVEVRSQLLHGAQEYEDLMELKLSLDMEINAYRKMLEVEEHRCG